MGKRLTIQEKFDHQVEEANKEIINKLQDEDFVESAVEVVINKAKNHLVNTMGVENSWDGFQVIHNSPLDKRIKTKVDSATELFFQKIDFESIIKELFAEEKTTVKIRKIVKESMREFLNYKAGEVAGKMVEEKFGEVLQVVLGKDAQKVCHDLVDSIEDNLNHPMW